MPSWLGAKDDAVTVLSGVKPGVYEPSTLAIGEEKDLAQHRDDELGFVRSAPLEQYLNEMRAWLIAASGKTKVPGRVMLLANPGFVAFSTLDGNVYVAMRLLESLESADEVGAPSWPTRRRTCCSSATARTCSATCRRRARR
jgi:hypothetical protein